MALRVLLADDHPLILAGIRRALEEAGGIEIVGEARVGSQVLPLVGRTKPDLVLLDIRMPQLDGLACLDLIRRRHAEVKVVVLSAFEDPEHVQAALRRGASAYVVKAVSPVDLPAALRQAVEGTVFHAVGVGDRDAETDGESGLTKREMTLLRALAKGLSNQAIGKELWITEQTVKFHLRNIYRKLGVSSRTEAARYAYEHGLIEASA
jgi:two-component system, NarL family, nitrate/nitrite response regulator NarL